MSSVIYASDANRDLSFISPAFRGTLCVESAYRGSSTDQYNLAMYFLEGTHGFRKNSSRGVYWLTQAVNGGEVLALNQLGSCYLEGTGVIKNEDLAFQFFKLGAEKGDPAAMVNAALLATKGCGTSVDHHLAAELLDKAAKQGYGPAAFQLGQLYLRGRGVPKDDNLAFQYFSRAVEAEVSEAYTFLAQCYSEGIGTQVDKQLAKKYWITASLNGDVVAQQCIGEKLLTGEDGFANDPEKARRYFARAAYAGDAQAQYQLAMCFDKGLGGPQDKTARDQWLEKAASQKHPSAVEEMQTNPKEPGSIDNELQEMMLNEMAAGTKPPTSRRLVRSLSKRREFLTRIFKKKSVSASALDDTPDGYAAH